ncbi:FAD-dependent oxidoreductase [Nocardia anaemiae]|uniref:FAD-dependent oxidoreductase n=1 Tax=Nocardia anaemiae TaxID=263910 RepID=UPI0007A54D5B|nr:NAD(P)/FAD-dependent oxidoreductase [Nocardia anaemiae]
MKIVIVGAGLAGPLLAQGLRQAGITVELYEREAAGKHSQSYRIALEPEGDLALRACLPSDRYERIVATAGKRGTGVRWLDPQLRVVREMLVPPTADEDVHGRHLTVDRLTLRKILLTGIDIHHGASFERFELLDDGRVRTYFDDGTVTDADLLVAADGTHSRIRTQWLPDAEVVETGQAEIYGKTALTSAIRGLTPDAALDGFSVVAGTDGRFMSLAAHEFASGDGDDYLMWVVAAPTATIPADLSTMTRQQLQQTATELIADWPENLAALVRHADPESVHNTTIRTAKPLPHWETGPVTLMGDAIHTMIPAGSSAGTALRDAALLCRRITERTGSLRDAVHAYETEMLAYGFAMVEHSLRSAT